MPAGGTVTVSAWVKTDAVAERHVFHLEVIGPDGRERTEHTCNRTALGGRATFSFDLALNDSPGRWTVRVTDVATGVKGEAAFNVTAWR